MNDVKRLVVAAVVLAFLAGLGAGAWVGDLRAAGANAAPSMDTRVEAYRKKYDLDASEQRRVRDVLLRYDAGRERVMSELDGERWKKLNELLTQAQKDIENILAERDSPGSGNGG
jgi:hypothetical protein